MIFFLFLIFLFSSLLLYIKIAPHYNIIDKPNIRSSHKHFTIRGGGIIFPISVLIYAAYSGFEFPYFIIGLFLISTVSFLDDLYTISNRVRLTIHLISVLLLFFQVGLFDFPFWVILIALIFIIGIINAYNFMDGINGITALYSLAIIGSLYLINKFITFFIDSEYFIVIGASLLSFGFFNVRKKAKVFAGDVGSVSMAFVISFLLITLMIKTHSIVWILLLSIYGIDTVITILFRIIRRENIFKAHCSHFYQFLVNEKKFNHIIISSTYSLLQILINLCIAYAYINHITFLPLILLFILIIFYLAIRFSFEGWFKLAKRY
ncbi:MAG: UDP-GlcNAc--UDP-phosphate GlcNAc-1-phosphate transferase [Chitinophagaceae bacterium]